MYFVEKSKDWIPAVERLCCAVWYRAAHANKDTFARGCKLLLGLCWPSIRAWSYLKRFSPFEIRPADREGSRRRRPDCCCCCSDCCCWGCCCSHSHCACTSATPPGESLRSTPSHRSPTTSPPDFHHHRHPPNNACVLAVLDRVSGAPSPFPISQGDAQAPLAPPCRRCWTEELALPVYPAVCLSGYAPFPHPLTNSIHAEIYPTLSMTVEQRRRLHGRSNVGLWRPLLLVTTCGSDRT